MRLERHAGDELEDVPRERASAVDELWNRLLESRNCALLCAYQLDIFELEAQTSVLPEIVRAHTHSRLAADTARLGRAA